MTSVLPSNVTMPIQALAAWLAEPETQQQIQAVASDAMAQVEQRILNDTSLRVPRREAERKENLRPWLDASLSGDFDAWLSFYKRRLAQQMQAQFSRAFPGVSANLRNKQMISEVIEASVWPEVAALLRGRAEELLLMYAIRGITMAWVSRTLGDTVLLGLPERSNDGWTVPIHDRTGQTKITEVVLDGDGKVLSNGAALGARLAAAP